MADKIKDMRALLDMSASCFEVQAATARQWAELRDQAANIGLANELAHKARMIREFLSHTDGDYHA